MPVHITCRQCKKVFPVKPYMAETARYCSRKCQALGQCRQESRDCEICGTRFDYIHSRLNKAKYCSRKCYHRAQSVKGTVEYKCRYCERTFLDAPSHKRVYCSQACVNKANHEVWKPTFTTVRKAMVARGKITECERCGYNSAPHILGVHHKDRDRHNNDLSNLEVLCPTCHSLEHAKHIGHGFRE